MADVDVYIGPAAGLATSLLWTASALLFAAAVRRISPTAVNCSRIALAVVLLAVTHRLLAGAWVPTVLGRQALYLSLSGLIGLVIGDQAFFHAFLDIGPRLTTLVATSAPLLAALFGWIVLDEALGGLAWIGIVTTVGGIAWVVLERPAMTDPANSPHRRRGVLLALVGAACQAAGLMLSKQGMGHGWLPVQSHLDPQAATLVRMTAAAVGMVPLLLLQRLRRPGPVAAALAGRRGAAAAGLLFASLGSVVGPYLGVWMSLVASDRAPLGVAQTMCSLTPIFILPFAAIVQRERLTTRAVLGAGVAVAGTALLFFRSAGA